MTPPVRPSLRASKRPNKLRAMIGLGIKLAFLAAVLFGVYYLYRMGNGPTQAPAQAQAMDADGLRRQPQLGTGPTTSATVAATPPATSPVPEPDQTQDIELETAGSIARQQLAAGKFKQRQTIAIYEETTRALDEWEKALTAWQGLGPDLLKSDDGRRIAGDPTLVKQFRAVLDQQRPTPDQLSAAKSGASDLVSPIREAVGNPDDASLPSDDIVNSLREIQGRARAARDELQNAAEQVRAILAHAGREEAETTLQDAIAAQIREEAEARTALITAEVRKAEEQGNKQIAEEKAKAALAAKQQEAESIRAEAERQATAAKAAEEQRAQVAKMALLRQKARSPEVRRYLAPFLASGFSQPKHAGGNGVIFDKIGDEGPMSLTRIRNVGGLDKGQNGILVLNWIASSEYNDRTVKWNYGVFAHQLTPDTMRFIKTSQDLLLELGDALVEEKMLAP